MNTTKFQHITIFLLFVLAFSAIAGFTIICVTSQTAPDKFIDVRQKELSALASWASIVGNLESDDASLELTYGEENVQAGHEAATGYINDHGVDLANEVNILNEAKEIKYLVDKSVEREKTFKRARPFLKFKNDNNVVDTFDKHAKHLHDLTTALTALQAK